MIVTKQASALSKLCCLAHSFLSFINRLVPCSRFLRRQCCGGQTDPDGKGTGGRGKLWQRICSFLARTAFLRRRASSQLRYYWMRHRRPFDWPPADCGVCCELPGAASCKSYKVMPVRRANQPIWTPRDATPRPSLAHFSGCLHPRSGVLRCYLIVGDGGTLSRPRLDRALVIIRVELTTATVTWHGNGGDGRGL